MTTPYLQRCWNYTCTKRRRLFFLIADAVSFGRMFRTESGRLYYKRLIVIINISVLAAATAIMLAASWLWHDTLAAIGLSGASPLPAILTGAILTAVITAVNTATIARLTAKC